MTDPLLDPALPACVAFLKPEEGCRLHPYQDVAGVWTIGYGNTSIGGIRVTATTAPLTEAGADTLLTATVAPLLAKVRAWVGRELTDAQWAGLVSFAYNLGDMTLFHSPLLTAVRMGQMDLAARDFAAYCHAGGEVVRGLVLRRAREAAAFRADAPHAPSTPLPVAHLGGVVAAVESEADRLNDAEVARHG